MRSLRAAGLGLAFVVAASSTLLGGGGASAAGEPSASTVGPVPSVGALFDGPLSAGHSCTASVLDSSSRDLVLAAAHCVSGTGVGMTFVPGYDDGATPYGQYDVSAAYADPAWLIDQDAAHDYVVLRVEPTSGHVPVEDVTGGNTIGLAPPDGASVTAVGYAQGVDDDPIACDAPVGTISGAPAFTCDGYVDGTSGSPWLLTPQGSPRTYVVGVIGGLEQGGCQPDVSFSSPFTTDVVALTARAARDGRPDSLPSPGPSGC